MTDASLEKWYRCWWPLKVTNRRSYVVDEEIIREIGESIEEGGEENGDGMLTAWYAEEKAGRHLLPASAKLCHFIDSDPLTKNTTKTHLCKRSEKAKPRQENNVWRRKENINKYDYRKYAVAIYSERSLAW